MDKNGNINETLQSEFLGEPLQDNKKDCETHYMGEGIQLFTSSLYTLFQFSFKSKI